MHMHIKFFSLMGKKKYMLYILTFYKNEPFLSFAVYLSVFIAELFFCYLKNDLQTL